MLKKEITIQNKLGLHARASMKLIDLAGRYQSDILIKYNNAEVNAKSIMNVMALAAAKGAKIELIVNGPDEKKAMQAVVDLINDKFGEDE